MWQAQITAVEPRAAKWRLGNGHRSRPLFGAYRSDGCARARPGAVLCEGSSTCWHVYEFSEHGGRRGQPLCASAAGVGGAGGVGVGVCDRIGAAARAPVLSMVGLARGSALLATPVRRCAPQWCAIMARDGSRLAARHVAS